MFNVTSSHCQGGSFLALQMSPCGLKIYWCRVIRVNDFKGVNGVLSSQVNMEELLSLKWNNHRSTFLHILGVLRDKVSSNSSLQSVLSSGLRKGRVTFGAG